MGPSCWPILTVRQCVIADGVGYPRTRFRSGVMPVARPAIPRRRRQSLMSWKDVGRVAQRFNAGSRLANQIRSWSAEPA
jgi:hypothetical protein